MDDQRGRVELLRQPTESQERGTKTLASPALQP